MPSSTPYGQIIFKTKTKKKPVACICSAKKGPISLIEKALEEAATWKFECIFPFSSPPIAYGVVLAVRTISKWSSSNIIVTQGKNALSDSVGEIYLPC